MNTSVCNFLPVKKDIGGIKAIRFVYETELPKLRQPFLHPYFALYLAMEGSATLHTEGISVPLKPGTLYFSFPGIPFSFADSENFTYTYITFIGTGANALLEQFDITPQNSVFPGHTALCELFDSSVRRVTQKNANVLAESLILHALSFITGEEESSPLEAAPDTVFETILNYVDSHYGDPAISLSSIGEIFSYSEKYLSALFKKNMKLGFNAYLRTLRIQRAQELLASQAGTLTEIAHACGYEDALYFSKVFKRHVGRTPSGYIRWLAERNENPGLKYILPDLPDENEEPVPADTPEPEQE